ASRDPVSNTVGGFLVASLIPAMSAGVALHVDGAVSPSLQLHLPTIQDIVSSWNGQFRKIAVKVAHPPCERQHGGTGVGCFFSGGVDSFYTLLKNLEEITTIVFVHGFDISLTDTSYRDFVSVRVK